MAVVASNQNQNTAPLPVPLGATGVNSANPNPFPVYVIVAGGTITANTVVNGVSTGVHAGTFLVNPGGTVNITYSSALTLTTTATGLSSPAAYPLSDPVFQNFTAQQYLTVGGAVNPGATDS